MPLQKSVQISLKMSLQMPLQLSPQLSLQLSMQLSMQMSLQMSLKISFQMSLKIHHECPLRSTTNENGWKTLVWCVAWLFDICARIYFHNLVHMQTGGSRCTHFQDVGVCVWCGGGWVWMWVCSCVCVCVCVCVWYNLTHMNAGGSRCAHFQDGTDKCLCKLICLPRLIFITWYTWMQVSV